MITENEKEATLKGMSEATKTKDQKPVYLPQNDPNHVRNIMQDAINHLTGERGIK